MALRGLPVFELQPEKKQPPLDSRWRHEGVTTDPTEAFDLRGNYGVRCDRLIVVDVDAHKGGFESLPLLGELPATFTVRTPRGGRHFYYLAPDDLALGQCQDIEPGIDIKAGNGAYVVGPGGTFEGKQYVAENMAATIAPCPPWIVDRLGAAPVKATNAGKIIGEVDTPSALAKARAVLEKAPHAVAFQGGNNRTYVTACRVMDEAVSPEACLDLMLEIYNPRCEPPWDADDLERIVMSAAEHRQEAIGSKDAAAGFEAAEIPAEKSPRDLIVYANEISSDAVAERARNAIIKQHLGPGDSGLVYGASTAGKSFVALDLALHIAHGRDWYGCKVRRRRPVLYVALEGVAGFDKRIVAALAEHGDPGKYLARLNVPVSLVRADAGAKGVATIVAAFRQMLKDTGERDGLIFVDTLARAIAGDNENAAEDMAHFVEQRQGAIARTAGAAVLVVHHENKAGGIRGSSVNFASQDFVLHVERTDQKGGVRQVTIEKSKDGTEGPLFSFMLSEHELGIDADGDRITSCTVQRIDTPPGSDESLTAAQRAFLDAFKAARAEITDPETGEVLSAATSDAVRKAMIGQVPNKSTRGNYRTRLENDGLPCGIIEVTIAGQIHYVDKTAGWR